MKYDSQISMNIGFTTDNRTILRFDYWPVKDVLEDEEDLLSKIHNSRCSEEEAERYGVYAIMKDQNLELPMWVADLETREAAQQFCDLQNVLKRDILTSSLTRAFMTVNWAMLKEQKLQLLQSIRHEEQSPDFSRDQIGLLDGLLSLIDGLQDAAIEDGLTTEGETLLMEREEEESYTLRGEITEYKNTEVNQRPKLSGITTLSQTKFIADEWIARAARAKCEHLKIWINDEVYFEGKPEKG